MKIETFLLERWMTRHETNVRYDIAESGILPLSHRRPAGLRAAATDARQTLDELLRLPLGLQRSARHGEHCATMLAETYARGDADHILVTTGAIEANFLLFNVLLDAGDHMIAPYPAYQQLYSVPRAIGCDVSLWHVGPGDGLSLRHRRARTAGHAAHEGDRRQHAAQSRPARCCRRRTRRASTTLAESVGATVIGDEAYRWLAVPDGEPFAPPFFDLGARGISVGTLSKPFGLPGLRIGWIAGPPDLIQRAGACATTSRSAPAS